MGVTEMKERSLNIADIELHVAEIIINELKIEDVTPQTFDVNLDLVDELGIDSMDLATVALVLQDEYDVEIDETDYPRLTTIHLIAEYLKAELLDESTVENRS